MDLAKMTNQKKLEVCRWYFRVGFAMLPFLWTVNAIWFLREAFIVPQYEEQQQIRKYVIFSGIGAFVWAAVLLAWVITFQTQRAAWGDFADSISHIFPEGRP